MISKSKSNIARVGGLLLKHMQGLLQRKFAGPYHPETLFGFLQRTCPYVLVACGDLVTICRQYIKMNGFWTEFRACDESFPQLVGAIL